MLTKVISTPWFSDLSNGLEEVAFLNSMNENPELHDDSITLMEQLLTDLFQLIHGTLKKIIPSDLDDDDEFNGSDNDKNAMMKKGQCRKIYQVFMRQRTLPLLVKVGLQGYTKQDLTDPPPLRGPVC